MARACRARLRLQMESKDAVVRGPRRSSSPTRGWSEGSEPPEDVAGKTTEKPLFLKHELPHSTRKMYTHLVIPFRNIGLIISSDRATSRCLCSTPLAAHVQGQHRRHACGQGEKRGAAPDGSRARVRRHDGHRRGACDDKSPHALVPTFVPVRRDDQPRLAR